MKIFFSTIKWFRSKIYLALFLLITIFIIGVLGFMYLSNYTLVEAIYMTVITVTTVGFGEVKPLDDASKLFTVFLILTSVGVYLYAVSIFTEYIANGDLFKKLNLRKVEKRIDKLKNHTIIVGYGRNGKQAGLKLKKSIREYLIIENDPKIIQQLEEDEIICLHGDATEDEMLEKAGIMHAHSIILALPSDADNLFISISAKQQNPNILVISRATNESSYRKLKIAGVDNVIMPDKIGGDHMASLVVSPDLIEFVDKLSLDGDCETNLQELLIDNNLKQFENKSIMDLDIRRKTGCNVIGLKMPNGDYKINPSPHTLLEIGSKIIVLGDPSQIENLRKYF